MRSPTIPKLHHLVTLALGLALAVGASVRARAQDADPEAVRAVRELDGCVSSQQRELARIAGLIADAEARAGSSDAALARDAREAIVTLLERARATREALARCVEDHPIPSASASASATTISEAPRSGSAEDRVSRAGGTVREVHPAEELAESVRVTRGERVDGRGEVPSDALQRAVRGRGAELARCYDGFVDRVGARRGQLELSFVVSSGRSGEVRIESASGFDAAFRGCVTQALSGMPIPGASGRAVFSYVFAIGPR